MPRLHWLVLSAIVSAGCAGGADPATPANTPSPDAPATAALERPEQRPGPAARDTVTVASELDRLIAATNRIDGVEVRYDTIAGPLTFQVWDGALRMVLQHKTEGTFEVRFGAGQWIRHHTSPDGSTAAAAVNVSELVADFHARLGPHLRSPPGAGTDRLPPRMELRFKITPNSDPGTERPHALTLEAGFSTQPGPVLGWLAFLKGERFHGMLFEDHLRFDMDAEGPVFIEISREHGFPLRIGREQTAVITLAGYRTGVPSAPELFAATPPDALAPEMQRLALRTWSDLLFRTGRAWIFEDWQAGAGDRAAADARATAALHALFRWRMPFLTQDARTHTVGQIDSLAAALAERLQDGDRAEIQNQLDVLVARWREQMEALLAEAAMAMREEAGRLEDQADDQAPEAFRALAVRAAETVSEEAYSAPIRAHFEKTLGPYASKK